MVRELSVGGRRLYEILMLGRENKCVITEDETWFLPFEDNASAPPLGEMRRYDEER